MAPAPRSERTARDNARAQALGYRDYYDFRVHGYGRIPPGEPVTPEMRRSFRGHAGLSDLIQAINRSRNRPIQIQPMGTERGADGRWKVILVVAVFRGRTGVYRQNYYLRGQAASSKNLKALRDNLSAPGSRRPPGGGAGGGGGTVPLPAEGAGDDDGEETEDGRYYDYWDYADDYDDYDYEPIPFVAASSIGEFSA